MSNKTQPKPDPKPAPKSAVTPAPSFGGWGEVRKSVQNWVDKHTPQGSLRRILSKASPKVGSK